MAFNTTRRARPLAKQSGLVNHDTMCKIPAEVSYSSAQLKRNTARPHKHLITLIQENHPDKIRLVLKWFHISWETEGNCAFNIQCTFQLYILTKKNPKQTK